MWTEIWQKLNRRQKVVGTTLCILVGIVLFTAVAALKVYLSPYSFTEKEYHQLRQTVIASNSDVYSLIGIQLKDTKTGKKIGTAWGELTVLDDETILRLYQELDTSKGTHRTELTITDRDLDGKPDDVFFHSYGNGKLTQFDNWPIGDEDIMHWNVWIVRFLEHVK